MPCLSLPFCLPPPPLAHKIMALTIQNSDYDLWDAWLHKICSCPVPFTHSFLFILSVDETTQQENWFMPPEETLSTGVAMRVEDGFFRVFPYENALLVPFEAAVRKLNPVVAVKIRNAGVQAAIGNVYVIFEPLRPFVNSITSKAVRKILVSTSTTTHAFRSLTLSTNYQRLKKTNAVLLSYVPLLPIHSSLNFLFS